MTDFIMLTLIAGLMIISPGPDFAVVVKNSLSNGRASGLFASMGVAFANFCHVIVNLLGLGVIISQSIVLFTIIKILGAVYLLYIGFKGILSKPEKSVKLSSDININPIVVPVKTKIKRQSFYNGVFTSLLNPKACLFYLSFFSVILSPDMGLFTQLFYGLWLSVIALLWFMLVALFFTSDALGRKMAAYKHWLERITGGILVLLGLKLLKSEATLSI